MVLLRSRRRVLGGRVQLRHDQPLRVGCSRVSEAAIAPRNLATTRQAGRSLRDVGLLLLAAFFIRAVWSIKAPLRADETFTVYWAELSPDFLLGPGVRLETNPPGYYLFMHYWMLLTGQSEFALRLPSMLFSVATVAVIYGIGRRLLDRTTALLAAGFAVIDPALFHYADEARVYAANVLLESLALLAMAGALRDRVRVDARFWGWLGLIVFSCVASCYAHYTSMFFIAACFAAVAVHLLSRRPLPLGRAAIWAAAGVVVLVAIAAPLRLAMSLSHSGNISWIGPLGPLTIRLFIMDLLAYPGASFTAIPVLVCLMFVPVVIAGARLWRPDATQIAVLVVTPATFVLSLAVTSVSRPVFISRVAVWLLVPFCLLLARAITLQRTARLTIVTAGLAAGACLIAGAHQQLCYDREGWSKAATAINDSPQCAGPVLFGDAYGLGLVYYQAALAARPYYTVPSDPLAPLTAELALTDMVMHPQTLEGPRLEAFIKTHPGTAFLVRDHYLYVAPQQVRPLLAQAPYRVTLPGGLVLSCF